MNTQPGIAQPASGAAAESMPVAWILVRSRQVVLKIVSTGCAKPEKDELNGSPTYGLAVPTTIIN